MATSTDTQWKWMRGQKLTVKLDNGTTARGDTYHPVRLSSNVIEDPAASGGDGLVGVCVPDLAASATGAVIISEDVFQVELATGEDPDLGDLVYANADGTVGAVSDGEVPVGVVVDYDPASGGLAHIKAIFEQSRPWRPTSLIPLEYAESGNLTSSSTGNFLWAAPYSGRVLEVGIRVGTTGTDSTDDLYVEGDLNIDGATCMTTLPKIDKAAADGADTFTSGTGVTVGVVDTAANSIAVGDALTVDFDLERTTPDTELSDVTLIALIELDVA